jgi:hypothetical protein
LGKGSGKAEYPGLKNTMRKWFLPVVLTLLGSCIVFALVTAYRSQQASAAAKAEAPIIAAQFGYTQSALLREFETCIDIYRSPCFYTLYYTTSLSQEEFRALVDASGFAMSRAESSSSSVRSLMMRLQYRFRGDDIDEGVDGLRWNFNSPGRNFSVTFHDTAEKGYQFDGDDLSLNIVEFRLRVE